MPTLTWTQQLQRLWLKGRQRLHPSWDPHVDGGLQLWNEALVMQDVAAAERLVRLQILPAQGAAALTGPAEQLLVAEPAALTGVSVAKASTLADVEWERTRQARLQALVSAVLAAGWNPLVSSGPGPSLMERAFQQGHLAWYRALKAHQPAWLNHIGHQGCPLYMNLVMKGTPCPENDLPQMDACWAQLLQDMTGGFIQPQRMGHHGQNLVSLALNHRPDTLRRLMRQWHQNPLPNEAPPEHHFQSSRVNVAEWVGNPLCQARLRTVTVKGNPCQVPAGNPADRAKSMRTMLDLLWDNGYQGQIWDADPRPVHASSPFTRNAQGQTAFHAWLKTGLLDTCLWAFFEEKERAQPSTVVHWWSRDGVGDTALEALVTREALWRTRPDLGKAMWHHVEAQITVRGLARGRLNAQGDTLEQVMERQIAQWDEMGSPAAAPLAHCLDRLIAARRRLDTLSPAPTASEASIVPTGIARRRRRT